MKYLIKYLIDFTALALLYVFVFRGRWKIKGKDILLVNTLMYIYLSFVLYFTMMPIITYIPFGFLFPLTTNRSAKFSKTVFFCFLMSLGIEILQPFFNRASDITDLITNVIGGMLGYGFYVIFKPITFWISDHLKTKKLHK